MKMRTWMTAITAGAVVVPVLGADVSITVENMLPAGSFSFSPMWLGMHDGTFDSFDAGSLAGSEIIAVAEVADTGPISAAFSAAQPGGAQTTLTSPSGPPMGPPVFQPGESATAVLNVTDPATHRYLSYASMVVPSNDLFLGNDNASAHEVFDAAGNFNGPFQILLFGSDVWDAGSEVNNAFGGAAFVGTGGDSVDESNPIALILPGGQAYLESFVGLQTADGLTLTGAFNGQSLLARITVVPAPGVAGGLTLMGIAATRRRRR